MNSRLVPALVLLHLLAGCMPAGQQGMAPPLTAIPPAAQTAAPLQLQLHAPPATAELGPATLVVDGYPTDGFSPQDFPLAHLEPSFRWVSPVPISTWPWQGSLDVPADGVTRLVAWLDFNDSGALDLGDHVAESMAPLPAPLAPAAHTEAAPPRPTVAEQQATATVSRIYVRRAAMARHVPILFEFTGDEETTSRDEGRILLYGFTADQLKGQDFPPQAPVFSWRSPNRERSWPTTFTVQVPVAPKLWLFPVLLDGDLEELEYSSRYGAPLGPLTMSEVTGSAVPLRIDRPMVMFAALPPEDGASEPTP